MAGDVIDSYAEAVLAVARGEGEPQLVEAELTQVAQAVDASDELKTTLSDETVPVARRQQIIEELLDGKASRVTTALVSMIVGAGHGLDLNTIADRVGELGATSRGRVVAEVRSAIPLDPEQQTRLAEALKTSTGKDVEVKVVIDPSVMGGLVTQIEDQVIDGSVRSRLAQLRKAF
jgi:F-type H+-transporting ATPase subunit delta